VVKNKYLGTLLGSVFLLLIQLVSVVRAEELEGVVQWSQRVELGTPNSGVIVAVPVKVGDRINKGQLLVQLEARALKARVKKAEAGVSSTRKSRAEAWRELKRAKDLYERTLLSNHDLEQQKVAYATANSHYQAASSALVEARLELEQSSIHAPFAGVVVQCNAGVGQSVVSNLQSVPLVTIANTHQMRVQADASQEQLVKLTVGQKVTVESGGLRYKGQISFIGLEPVNSKGEPRYPLQVLFATNGNLVRVGQPATVVTP